MICFDVTMEDSRIIGDRMIDNGFNPDLPWQVRFVDNVSGKHTLKFLTDVQVGALMLLVFNQDAVETLTVKQAYEIVEPILTDNTGEPFTDGRRLVP